MVKRVGMIFLALLLGACTIVSVVKLKKAMEPADSEVMRLEEERRMITDKSEYAVGDPIMVTVWTPDESDQVYMIALDSGNAMVRQSRVGERIPTNGNDVGGNGSGHAFDITQGKVLSTAWTDLPAGRYMLILFDHGMVSRFAKVQITIK